MTSATQLERRLLNADRRRFALDELPPAHIVTRSGHCRDYDETDRLVGPILGQVPITRVYDLTPLDSVGLPVWCAVTPLAKDLTVHGGKGLTAAASRLSAIMEAIERVSAEATSHNLAFEASYSELARGSRSIEPLDPAMFCLPFESRYSPETPVSWTIGYDLQERRYVFVARDLVVSPAQDGVCVGPETNGLASGNTITEATVHAIHEVVERDALAIEGFCHLHTDAEDQLRPPVRLIDPRSVPAESRSLIEAVTAAGLIVRIQDITTIGSIPAYRVLLLDHDFASAGLRSMAFDGSCADLDPTRAVARAITEAAQAHSALVLGARDTFEGMESKIVPAVTRERQAEIMFGPSLRPFSSSGREPPRDLRDHLILLLEALAADGARHCVVVNLTDERLGVPVVRVLVPDFAGIYGETRRRPGVRLLRRLIPFQLSDA